MLEAEGNSGGKCSQIPPTRVEAGVMGFSPFRPTVTIRKLSLTKISRSFEFNPEGTCTGPSCFIWELVVLQPGIHQLFTAGVLDTSIRSVSREVSSPAWLVSGGASC